VPGGQAEPQQVMLDGLFSELLLLLLSSSDSPETSALAAAGPQPETPDHDECLSALGPPRGSHSGAVETLVPEIPVCVTPMPAAACGRDATGEHSVNRAAAESVVPGSSDISVKQKANIPAKELVLSHRLRAPLAHDTPAVRMELVAQRPTATGESLTVGAPETVSTALNPQDAQHMAIPATESTPGLSTPAPDEARASVSGRPDSVVSRPTFGTFVSTDIEGATGGSNATTRTSDATFQNSPQDSNVVRVVRTDPSPVPSKPRGLYGTEGQVESLTADHIRRASTTDNSTLELNRPLKRLPDATTPSTSKPIDADAQPTGVGATTVRQRITGSFQSSPEVAPLAEGRDISLVELPEHVVAHIKLTSDPGSSSAELTLQPEHLGRLHITVEMQQGEAHLSLAADNVLAQEALLARLPELATTLREAGIILAEANVTVNDQPERRSSTAKRQDKAAGRVTDDPATTEPINWLRPLSLLDISV